METLADYGTVQYFGVSAFTTGIFRTWFGMDNSLVAAQLSAILLLFVVVFLYLLRFLMALNGSEAADSGKVCK